MYTFDLKGKEVAPAAFAARRAVNAIPGTLAKNSLGEPKTLVGIGVKKTTMIVKLLGDIAGDEEIGAAVQEAVAAVVDETDPPKKRSKK